MNIANNTCQYPGEKEIKRVCAVPGLERAWARGLGGGRFYLEIFGNWLYSHGKIIQT